MGHKGGCKDVNKGISAKVRVQKKKDKISGDGWTVRSLSCHFRRGSLGGLL